MLRLLIFGALLLPLCSPLNPNPNPRPPSGRREFIGQSTAAGVAFVSSTRDVSAEETLEVDAPPPLLLTEVVDAPPSTPPSTPPPPTPQPFPFPPPTYKLTRGFGEYAIPSIGFGLYKTSPEESEASVAAALDAGYRHFDTALLYGNEVGVGTALSKSNIPRRSLFLTTKVPIRSKGGDVRNELKASLKRLKTPYCDLCLVHSPIGGYQDRLITYAALTAMSEEVRVFKERSDELRKLAY